MHGKHATHPPLDKSPDCRGGGRQAYDRRMTDPTDRLKTRSTGRKPAPTGLVVAVLLTALVAFGPLSTDLYLPALPILVAALETDVPTVQWTLSAFLIGFALGQLLYGPLSDRFGRWPVLLGGLGLFTLATLGCALAPTIEWLIAWRFLQAVGACVGPVLGRAIVRDIYGPKDAARLLSYMAMAMALAPAIGPILGGFLTQIFGWRVNFWLLLGFGATVAVGVLLLLEETNRHKDPTATSVSGLWRNYRTVVSHRPFLGYAAVVGFLYGGIFTLISGSSHVFMTGYGLAPAAYGTVFAVIVLGYMVGAFGGGRLTGRFGIDRMVGVGLILCTVGAVALAVTVAAGIETVATIVAPFVIFMVGCGFAFANAMAGAVGPFPRMAGLASSLVGFSQMSFAALVGLAVGHATDGTAAPMAVSLILMVAGAGVAYLLLIHPARAAA